ncbi:MAG: hypothetical protein ACRDJ0_04385 [Actinomycetota bacterium]
MKYEVVFIGIMSKSPDEDKLTSERAEEELDLVMDNLLRINAEDPAIGVDTSEGQVEISVTVEAERLDDAVQIGGVVIGTAIHAAGGHTPGWEVDWCEGRAIRRDDPIPA